MRKTVVAVCCSDIHLSLRPPVARSKEKSWLGSMAYGLLQINELCRKHKVPLIIAGDIFDRWNMPAELINWALDKFPQPTYAIPGNHDLPMHQEDLIHRSAYSTLVQAGSIQQLSYKNPLEIWTNTQDEDLNLYIYAVPFDGEIPEHNSEKGLHICVIHQYLWVPGCEYNGATQDSRLSKWARKFAEFDVVIVGDNHVAFDRTLRRGTHVINCGAVFRRKSNEALYKPRVGLIYSNGDVAEHRLDCSQDKLWLERGLAGDDYKHQEEDMEDVMVALSGMEKTSANFRDAIMEAIKIRKATKQVKQLLLEAME